nr:hypothetical protein [Tanacetum cinerariifolium]
MVAYLTKSNASEGFNQIIDFLNRSYLKYALTVNPKTYVSCIKQFWTIIAIKQVNDVTRLQALVYKKRVVVTEAVLREVLRLDDAEGVDCLPNEEIFIELARIGYEKPSTKLTFYKAFFSSQWKFLIHTILQCMSRKFNFSKYIFDSLVRNVDSTKKFYMYPRFLQLLIRKQVGDRSTRITKYALPTLTQKVIANIRKVGKGFSRVDIPLFEGMLVAKEIEEERDAYEHVEDVTTSDDARGNDTTTHKEVPTVTQEPSIPSPTPPTPLTQPPQDLPLTSQVQQIPPQSPQRVDTSDDTVMDDESSQGRMIVEIDKDDVVVLMDDKEEDKKVEEAKVVESAQEDKIEPAEVQEVVDVVTTAKLITKVVTAASEIVTAASVIIPTAEPQVPVVILYATPTRVVVAPSSRRKGVVIRDPREESTTSTIIPKTKSKDKGKKILVDEPKPLKKKQQIEMDEEYARKLHTKEQIEEEENRALQTINETPVKKVANMRKLNEEVEDLKRHLEIVPDEDDDVYTEATPLARKLILLIKRRYPLSRFTLDQMLNAVRLQVEEESKVSLELFKIHKTTSSRRPTSMMVEYILHQAQEQDLDQAS